MLELAILEYLMIREANCSLVAGELVGFTVTPVMISYGVPKATFYRALRNAIDMGFVTKKSRGHYTISQDFRQTANSIKDGKHVS